MSSDSLKIIFRKLIMSITVMSLLRCLQLTSSKQLTFRHKDVLELADCRGVSDISRLTEQGVEYSSSLECLKPGSRLVILIPPNNTMLNVLAGIYEASSEKFREEVVVMNELSDAVNWLTDDLAIRKQIMSLYI